MRELAPPLEWEMTLRLGLEIEGKSGHDSFLDMELKRGLDPSWDGKRGMGLAPSVIGEDVWAWPSEAGREAWSGSHPGNGTKAWDWHPSGAGDDDLPEDELEPIGAGNEAWTSPPP